MVTPLEYGMREAAVRGNAPPATQLRDTCGTATPPRALARQFEPSTAGQAFHCKRDTARCLAPRPMAGKERTKRRTPALLTAFLAGMSMLAAGCRSNSGHPSAMPLTTVEQVRGVTAKSAAEQIPVHLRGTVMYADPGLKLLFVQDATGGIRVETMPSGGEFLDEGQFVELTGMVASGGSSPAVVASTVHVLSERTPTPAPVRATANGLVSGHLQYREVEIQGIVRSAAFDHTGRLGLAIHADDRDIKAWVRNMFGFDYHTLVDSRVRVRGVLSTRIDARDIPLAVRLWVPSIGGVEILERAPAFADIPARTVASLLANAPLNFPAHRVRLRGFVSLDNAGYVLKDASGAVPLRVASSESIETGGPFDLLGFATNENGSLTIGQCSIHTEQPVSAQTPALAPLTSVAQVHGLSEDEAVLSRPVNLRAVVTYSDPATSNTFVQDETGGIYLAVQPGTAPALRLGQLVEVDGFTGPGEFAPVITNPRVRVLAEAGVPKPFPIGMEQLFTGVADSRWVEATGIVHSIGSEGEHATMGVGWGVYHFKVHVLGTKRLPASLLDSEIRVEGVCGALFNFRRQILGIQVLVPNPGLVRVVRQGTPYNPPLRSIGQLLQFSISDSGRRSRIRGVVTLTHPEGPTYVSDASGGVRIENHAAAALQIGDLVEVTGFASPGPFNPVLYDAEIRRLGSQRFPEPAHVTADDVLEEGYDSELVRIDAVLVEQVAGEFGQKLVLETGDRLIEARIDGRRLPALDRGSLLRITGVVSIRGSETPQTVQPSEFSILLRSPNDVAVLQEAPWWRPEWALELIRIMALLVLLAIVWVVVLRRRVHQQTADLRRSREMLELVLDQIPQRVFWKDRESRYLGCNKTLAADAGVSGPAAIVGKTDHDLSWRSMAESFVADDRTVIESGQPKRNYEETIVDGSGNRRQVRTNKVPLHSPDGRVIGILGVYDDITNWKLAQDALRNSEARLARAQRIAKLGNWGATAPSLTADSTSEPYYWSDEVYRIFGVSRETFTPTLNSFLSLVHPEDREQVESAMRKSLAAGNPYDADHRILCPDGAEKWVREHAELDSEDPSRARMIGTVQDITEYKRLQDQLLQAQRLESIGRLAGGVAHDFNNLLSVILCCAELVLEDVPADSPVLPPVTEIRDAAERAAGLTQQLLAFGRKQVIQPKILDLNAVIRDLEGMLARLMTEDIELVTRLAPQSPVMADPGQINQVLMNLAVNARDAMPAGGKLTIETRDIVVDANYQKERPDLTRGTYVSLLVTDNGLGMDEETRSHLFEPFFTTKGKGKGTGLGLPTVYGIVTQMGGHIWVRSEPGRGTTFHICLPRVAGPLPLAVASKVPVVASSGTETVLVVEDQADVRRLAAEVLLGYGYTIFAVASGPAALEFCESYSGPIHLMLTDVIMPAMTGRELADRLKQARPEVKVLFMSGYTGDIILHRGTLDPGIAYLQKPFSPASLAAKVRETLDAHNPGFGNV